MSHRRKILILAGIVLGVAILVAVIHHYQLRFAVESYIAELKAKGEPMDLAQVIPPPVPPEHNGADIFRAAASLIEADKSLNYSNYVSGMKITAPGKAMVRWQQPDIRESDGTNSWQGVTAVVAQNEKSFGLLQQIINKPDFDFHIEYERGIADMAFTNFCLSELKHAANRLATAALCDLHRGDTASALKNLRGILAVTKAMRDERFVISELVRMACAHIALTASWELLQSPNLTDAQLAELQQDWAVSDFIETEADALAMERVGGEISLANWRKSSFALQDYFARTENALVSFGMTDETKTWWVKINRPVQIFMWRNWWSYSDQLRALKGYDSLITTVRLVRTNGCFVTALKNQTGKLDELGISRLSDNFLSLFTSQTDFHSMLSQSIIGLSGVTRKTGQIETAKQMVVCAIALKRFQIGHGHLPLDLNSLAPEFVSAAPRDPMDGQPLRYRRNADGTFLLYSVGENGVDDGGNPALEKNVTGSNLYWQSPHSLDWVWPQPATATEIQKYYAEQAKKPN